MSVHTVTHLNFSGQARAALTFYQTVFGGEMTAVTYRDAHNVQTPADADNIMWGQVASESGFQIMAYDVQTGKSWHPGDGAFYVALRGDSVDEITLLWSRLVEGGQVRQPLQPAAWGPLYGMVTDRFGITWVVDVKA